MRRGDAPLSAEQRAPPAHSGDFVDGAGGDWDVKAPKSRQSIISNAKARAAAESRKEPAMDPARPIPGEFVVETLMKQIQKELAAGERVIIDTEGLTTADLELLKAAVSAAGLDGQVVFHE